MDTTPLSQEIPPDVVVHVADIDSPLHKFVLVSKSNYIRKLIVESESADLSRIDISGIPGGSHAFERAAKFCYGVNFEITVHNVAALRCAAEYLEMTEEYSGNNLAGRTDEFLTQVALQTLRGAVAVLKSCEELLPVAEDLLIVQRCVEIASAKACVEVSFPSHSPLNWWTKELSILNIPFFGRVLDAMKSRGAKGLALASATITYVEMSLCKLVHDSSENEMKSSNTEESAQRELLEGVVALLPSGESLFPINFLCYLLSNAIFLKADESCKNKLEKRISAILDHATVDELLMLSFTKDGEKLYDLESVKKIISEFVEKERSVAIFNAGDFREVFSTAMQKVAKVIDAYLGEVAICSELSITKFNGIVNLVPKEARRREDDLYRAVDIYLKAHPHVDELEREKVCSGMDPHKLSREARAHAAQNKCLPIQIVLHALYYDQLKARSGVEDCHIIPDAISVRNKVQVDVSLAKENEALRTELLKMKMYIQDIQKFNQKESPRTSEKRVTFLSSMSKTLGRWNPFNKIESKDTLSIPDGVVVKLTKTRKRRFSIA